MTGYLEIVRNHYDGPGLVDRIKAALSPIAPQGERLNVAQLATLDQFHTRGALATAELAGAANLEATDRVLDIGCGVGGPARYMASTVGCHVTGVDISPSFIDAANYLTARCGLADKVTFLVGDAAHLPFSDDSFDSVFLQHVAMNISDRSALYGEVRRVLKPGGRFATYDIVHQDGDVLYPVPWARDASTSFLMSAADSGVALEAAGFKAAHWRDDAQIVLDWIESISSSPLPTGPNLGVIMGSEFPVMQSNLIRNIRKGHLGVLSAVLTCN